MTRMSAERPDFTRVLGRLKDFQLKTVDRTFDRLYLAPDSTHRFLVADEVGLGKTVVASGVIAKTIDHLWDSVDRIDIVYVCSNIDIARQNVNKLNVMAQKEFSKATRLTLLPLEISGLRGNKVNFVSFTPGTSFDVTGGTGQARERALLYCLLRSAWGFGKSAAPINVLSAYSSSSRFRDAIEAIDECRWYPNGIDPDLQAAFTTALEVEASEAALANRESLRDRFNRLCSVFTRSDRDTDRNENSKRNLFIGDLRQLLARTCIQQLQPDLVILDEFQRFKDLLGGEGDAAELAKELFEYSDENSAARVLLLSATPYKMYTMRHEFGDDDHYADFVATLRFLFNNESATAELSGKLTALRKAIYRGTEARSSIQALKAEIEQSLRRVMSRTERLAATVDRSGMLKEVAANTRLAADDAAAYCAMQRIGREVDHPDVVEFWKSAPFLLNFMDSYKLKDRFLDCLNQGEEGDAPGEFRKALRAGIPVSLPHDKVESQRELRHPHPRMRWLIDDVVGRGSWRLLWLPPSLPYYRMRGVFAEPGPSDFTKRLIFSAWRVAPKAIATLVSYEAERRMFAGTRRGQESRTQQIDRLRPLLNFSRSSGRLTGMPVLGLVYPSITLARLGDPLDAKAGELSIEELLKSVEARLAGPLAALLKEASKTPANDEAWYWAAPILLDLRNHVDVARAWLRRPDLASRWSGADAKGNDEEADGWRRHIGEVTRLMSMGKFHKLGTPPADLIRVLAEMAIGSPAVCALRALSRSPEAATNLRDAAVRDAAGQIAHGFRGLFNLPEVISLIRGLNSEEPYWRRILEYSIDGCLQAVLDEYVHVLQGWEGLTDRSTDDVSSEIADRIRQAIGLRTSRLGVDSLVVAGNGRIVRQAQTMRTRFAMRFGDEISEDEKDANRKEHVRTAFNSPFWPFVLASTSVGQEGLDFHLYCHSVVHWNVPSNPVDLEQREGRVHRFKGHAVRKNVAAAHGRSILRDTPEDPWRSLFDAAAMSRREGASELEPYWLYTTEGGAVIERHVPHLPLSRDASRYSGLKKALASYRMVFGQARQEDLLDYLTAAGSDLTAEELRIDLSPA